MALWTGSESGGRAALVVALALSLVAAGLAGRTLLEPGFYDSHDGLLNVHRLFEFEKCLDDGPTPCRWAPDMGYGYGTPLFVFYPPLSTHVSMAFRLLGASRLDAVKLSLLASFVVGALAMFALAYRFFGASGATVASVLYTWAPYRAVDVFARGAMAEAWGLALVPLVFLTGERAMCSRERAWPWSLAAAVAWAALLSTHNLTTMMIAPAYAAWCLLWLVSGARSGVPRTWRSLVPFAVAHLAAVALAAYYVVPSLVEQRYAHIGTLGTLYAWARWENNFVTLRELLLGTTPWGYGAFRQPGGISLFVGTLHGALALAAMLGVGAALARSAWTSAAAKSAARAAMLLGLVAVGGALMTTPVSRVVWESVPALAFLQFPWRFLVVVVFGASFAAGWLPSVARPRWAAAALAVGIAGLAIFASFGRFAPSTMVPVREEVLANEREVARMRHGLFDYLPIDVELSAVPRRAPATAPPPVEAIDGAIEIGRVVRASHGVAFDAVVESSAPAVVRVNVFRFPGWTLRIDGVRSPEASVPDALGRLHVAVPPGRHRVEATFEPTRVRAAADALSLAAAVAVSVWALAMAARALRAASDRRS